MNRLYKTITGEIGTILPATWYRDGDAVACRINALICRNRKDAGIYVHQLMDEGEITLLLRALTFYVQPQTPDASAQDTLGWIRAFFLWDENIIVTYSGNLVTPQPSGCAK